MSTLNQSTPAARWSDRFNTTCAALTYAALPATAAAALWDADAMFPVALGLILAAGAASSLAGLADRRKTGQERWTEAIADYEADAESQDRIASVLEWVGVLKTAARCRDRACDLRVLAAQMRADEQHGGQS